jgi:hypothetical protein
VPVSMSSAAGGRSPAQEKSIALVCIGTLLVLDEC